MAKKTTETQGESAEVKSTAKTAVNFVLADGRKRSFTQDEHGDDFVALSDEFHKTNKIYVQTRTEE